VSTIAVLCMGGRGHVGALLPLVTGLVAGGATVYVLTRLEYGEAVERAGGRFRDLYADRPLAAADATSVPLPCRFVSFAAVYAEGVAAELAALRADLIVHDTFTVVAAPVAVRLERPRIAVYTNHAPVPERMIADLRHDPRVAVSDECRRAVERLEREHGIRDAHPFWYYDAKSPLLNLAVEPAEFLDEDERRALEPVAFFGSLDSEPPPPARTRRTARPRLYASCGTAVWRYYEAEALAALAVVVRSLAEEDVDVLVTLGGHSVPGDVRETLERANVRIADFVDQRAVLAGSDVFLTHHGRGSTQEAVFHQVPMLSYPFFGDQPWLARRCADLGLALPLARRPREPLDAGVLRDALMRVRDERERFDARLREARGWQLRTIAGRGEILDRVLGLAEQRTG
jgi:MGT family glycosyltransferase